MEEEGEHMYNTPVQVSYLHTGFRAYMHVGSQVPMYACMCICELLRDWEDACPGVRAGVDGPLN